jgi:hypothetical protein
MDDYPIKIGRMLFTMVDPQRGSEVAYNRWYERDHFYAGCMIGSGWFAGSRWVAPRELKDLRFPEKSPVADPVDAGSYLSIYWILKDQEDPGWAGRQVQWLYANGRGFPKRDHVHTAVYDYLSTVNRDDDGVPVELALDHHYPGLGVVVVEPADGTTHEQLKTWLEAEAVPSLLGSNGVDMVASWALPQDVAAAPAQPAPAAPGPGGSAAPGSPGGPSLGSDGGRRDRIVQLAFIEGDPTAAWDAFKAYAKTVDAGGKGKVTFAAPFYATVVGTDTYADQLW